MPGLSDDGYQLCQVRNQNKLTPLLLKITMKFPCQVSLFIGMLSLLNACGSSQETVTVSGLNPLDFETEVDGKKTGLYTLTNQNGMEVCVTNFGGRIVSMMVPDRDGRMIDVVLGFDSIASYLPENNLTDFGASIGRYANRIANGRMIINGDTIRLPQNNFGHCLHGGSLGWQYRVYDVKESTDSTLVLEMDSPDGDNGFPGNVKAVVRFVLKPDNALDIAYTAVTDRPTVINLTNHSYFNLNGDPEHPVNNHRLYLNAANYTPVDSTFMTTGEIASVLGTPFDFTKPRLIGDSIDIFTFEQLKNGNGYDHNWVLDNGGDDKICVARVYAPSTGINLEVYTDEPGLQVYSGNFLDGSLKGKKGKTYVKRAGLCLETQHYPDSPNKPQWPSVVLEPGKTYTSHCVYKFGTGE